METLRPFTNDPPHHCVYCTLAGALSKHGAAETLRLTRCAPLDWLHDLPDQHDSPSLRWSGEND